MAPRAVISGGESLDSPMRVTYENSSDSENEQPGHRPTLKQVLKKPSRLLLRRSSIGKVASSPSISSPRPSSSAGPAPPVIPPRTRSLKFTPSLQSLQQRPRSRDTADVFGRDSPLMETKSMASALPELDQPAPKRILPRTNLEAIMTIPISSACPRDENVLLAHETSPAESAITAFSHFRGMKAEDGPQPQKRKSSGELADGDARSLPKTKADVVAEARSKKGPKSITRSAFAETAVMQWMDGVDVNGQRSPERTSIAGSSSPSKPSSHAAVVLTMLDQNRENIAQAAAKLCNAASTPQGPPVPVPERDASARRKRDSSMTATSFTPSVFSRTSSYTENSFLTTPSEMVVAGQQSKRTSRDSRDSWRYTRSFASPRSSVMSYNSMAFRTRPFKPDDFPGGPDDAQSTNNSPTRPDLPNRDQVNDEHRFSRDSESFGKGSYPGSEHLSVSFPRPLSLSPVEENPEIHVTSEMDIDALPELKQEHLTEDQRDEKASMSNNTLDLKGTIASTSDSLDVGAKRTGRFCKGAFSPGMPTEIFGYHTLDFSASRLSEDISRQPAPSTEVDTIAKEEQKMDEVPAKIIKSLEHRRSSSSDVLNADLPSPPLPKEAAIAPKTIRQEATVLNSVSSSEASSSPIDSEFGEGSSGISDYTDDDIYLLSDVPGVGRAWQIALANIRRDVVRLVIQELNGISTHAHEANGYGNNGGAQVPSNLNSSAGPSGSGQYNGNMGGNKRGARDPGDDQQDDREDRDPGKRRKLNTGMHSSILRSRFACPFYKRNPDSHQRWRSCRGPGWEEVRRVKEHVYRRHMLFTCPRCLQHFEEKGLLDEHAQSDVPCTKASTPPPQDIEGCSQEQERKLRCRKRPPGETDEDRWAEMYRILFGDDCEVPGPYYDFDLPTTSPSPSDLPIIEDTFRHLPQRLAQDISRRLRRPLDDDERDALPEIIRTSLQAIMPPFWRMFAATPGSDARGAPPASEQGDSAYGSAEHDRESSAPPRGHNFAQMSQTNVSQSQTPTQTPGQQQQHAAVNHHPPPSRDFSFTQNVEYTPQYSAWPQTSQSFATMPQITGTSSYPQTSYQVPVTMAQKFGGYQAHHDPPVHEDFSDLLVPQQFASSTEQQPKETGLRWQIPTSIPGSTGGDLPALPIDTIPFTMPITTEAQHFPVSSTNYSQPTMTPTTTMGPSPNFLQYNINAPQMMNQFQPSTSMAYHESNSGAVRTPNRNSVNLLTSTDQIDSWMCNLNSHAAGIAQGSMQDVFLGGNANMAHHMNGMNMGVVGKKRRPEVGYTRG